MMSDTHHVARSQSIAIIGGRATPASGPPIDPSTVLILDGEIAAVAAPQEVGVPSGVTTIDASGSWVLPGLVEAHSHLGIDEEAGGWAGDDLNEATDPNGARFRAIDAINPADIGFADALAGGVTTAVVLPGSASPIGGQAVALKTWGRTIDEMVVKAPVGVKSALGENPKRVYGKRDALPSTRQGIAAVIRMAFAAADHRRRHGRPEDPADLGLDTLIRVLDGELPLLQHAHRADDIATALRLADEFGYRLIVNHGTEAHHLADVLAARSIPVVCGPLIGARTKLELAGRTLRSPAALARAGVQFALTTDHNELPIQFLAYQAALAVREGLSRHDALRAITVNPARILGLEHRVGDLARGLDGDVTVWSGDPFDIDSRVTATIVEGRRVWSGDGARAAGRLVGGGSAA
jgi:imidazolonepropionase-like amidohydrolase